MFEHFTTLHEIFHYKLGSALTMEYDSLDMLEDMENAVMRSDLKELFHGHAAETRRQIENLHNCFSLLGEEVHREPSPTTKGLAKEAKSIISKTDNMLVDAVVLAGALEAEHYAIAVYETLLVLTKASGATGPAELLSENLDQEKATAEKIKAALDWVTRADAEDQKSRNEEEAGRAERTSEPTVQVPGYLPPGGI